MPIELTVISASAIDENTNRIFNSSMVFDDREDLIYFISTGVIRNCQINHDLDDQEYPIDQVLKTGNNNPILVYSRDTIVKVEFENTEYNIRNKIWFIDHSITGLAFNGSPIVDNPPVTSLSNTKRLFKQLTKYFIEISKDHRLSQDTTSEKITIVNHVQEDPTDVPFSSFHFNCDIDPKYREDDPEYEFTFDCSIKIHHTSFRTFVELECITIPTPLQSKGILSGIIKILATFMKDNNLSDVVFCLDGSDEGWTTMACEKYEIYPDWTIGEVFNLKHV